MQRLLLGLARWAVQRYYRVEHLGGAVPARGPVVLVGNHPNGLVDPVLVASATTRPVRFLGKAPLFEMPVLGQVMRGLAALPVYRSQDGADTAGNAATFEAVFAALERAELVCLFPEGKSHDEPALQKLKTGAARMALGAEARRAFALGVAVVPVGLVYHAKPRFRSRVCVWTGPALFVRELAELHARDERAAVVELTERIAAALRAVTLDLERWEDRPLLELAERILFSAEEGRTARLQAFALALHALRARDPERVQVLAARIGAFGERLRLLALAPEDVPGLARPYRAGAVLRYALRTLAVLLVGLPLALGGALLWFLPHRFVGWLGRTAPGADTMATVRILAAFVFFPLWWLGLGAGAWRAWGPAWAGLVGAAAPLLGLVALAYRDWREETWGEVRTFLRLASRRRLRELLAAEREALARELEALRASA